MKGEKMFFTAVLLGLALALGLPHSTWAVEAEDSVYGWGSWGKAVTPAAGPSVPTLAVGGAGGFEYAPPRPLPLSGPPGGPGLPNVPGGPPGGPGLPNVPGAPPGGPGLPNVPGAPPGGPGIANAPGGGPPGVPALPGAP